MHIRVLRLLRHFISFRRTQKTAFGVSLSPDPSGERVLRLGRRVEALPPLRNHLWPRCLKKGAAKLGRPKMSMSRERDV